MARNFDARQPGFDQEFRAFLAEKREQAAAVGDAVRAIIADVRTRGDAALADYTARFDRVDLAKAGLQIAPEEIATARRSIDAETLAALELAAERIADFHRRQLPADLRYVDDAGVTLGYRWTPIAAVGIYVPGGKASYPSSVLMNAIPAKVAGVSRLVMAAPTPDGHLNPYVLAAADIAGIDEMYRIGGAQAVAALAYGAKTIAAVDKITGPGNAYVAEAKRQVFGVVGIDMIAGPSEIVVVADGRNNPAWIAADLLSQAEHDEDAQAILITDDDAFATAVAAAAETHLATLNRAAIARASWQRHGAVIVVPSLDAVPAIVDAIAPEHLELAVADPEALLGKITNAGAVFLGRHAPEAIGDYVAGPNHVLPTSGSARFSSGLSVMDFMKRTTIVGGDAQSLAAIGPAAARLADAEGLGAHALSVTLRLKT